MGNHKMYWRWGCRFFLRNNKEEFTEIITIKIKILINFPKETVPFCLCFISPYESLLTCLLYIKQKNLFSANNIYANWVRQIVFTCQARAPRVNALRTTLSTQIYIHLLLTTCVFGTRAMPAIVSRTRRSSVDTKTMIVTIYIYSTQHQPNA